MQKKSISLFPSRIAFGIHKIIKYLCFFCLDFLLLILFLAYVVNPTFYTLDKHLNLFVIEIN